MTEIVAGRGGRPGARPGVVVLALAAAAVLACPAVAPAGAWSRPEGGLYLKVWDRTLIGDEAYGADGDRIDLGERYQDHALRLYLEHGLAPGWTLVATGTPIGYARFGDRSTGYAGPLSAGLRRGWTSGPWALAVEGRYGYAPDAGVDVLGAGVADGEAFAVRPTLETHRGTAELQVGRGLGWGWASGHAGIEGASEGAIDAAWTASLQLGVDLDPVTIAATVSAHQPLGSVEEVDVLGVGQTRYVGLGLDVAWEIVPGLSLVAGVGGAAAAESNAAAPALTLGLAHAR